MRKNIPKNKTSLLLKNLFIPCPKQNIVNNIQTQTYHIGRHLPTFRTRIFLNNYSDNKPVKSVFIFITCCCCLSQQVNASSAKFKLTVFASIHDDTDVDVVVVTVVVKFYTFEVWPAAKKCLNDESV